MVAAGAGLLVGWAALQLLGSLNIQELPRGEEIRLDGIVVAYTIGVSALIGLVLGMIPVANVLPANLTIVLREEGRTGTSGRGARTLRRGLVVAQVGFAFMLLIGAGLMFASFRHVLAVDPGFTPDGVLTASISLPRARYADDHALISFTHEALRGLRELPGVSAVGATDTIPFGGNHSDSVIFAEGYQMKAGESVVSPNAVDVTPGYFEAMGVKLRARTVLRRSRSRDRENQHGRAGEGSVLHHRRRIARKAVLDRGRPDRAPDVQADQHHR